MSAFLIVYFGILVVLASGYGLEVFLYSTATPGSSLLVLVAAIFFSAAFLILLRFVLLVEGVTFLRRRFLFVAALSQIALWSVLAYAYNAEPRSAALWEWAAAVTCAVLSGVFVYWLGHPRIGQRSLISRRVLRAAGMLSFLLIVVFATFPVPIGTLLGPMVAVLLSTTLLIAVIATATKFLPYRRPLIALVICSAVISVLFARTTPIRTLVNSTWQGKTFSVDCPSKHGAAGLVSAKDAFDCWFNANRDKDGQATMFLIAAAGGGSKAAAWTMTVLSELDRQVPNFSNRLFAISGVSGGGLGGATFIGELREREHLPNCRPAASGGLSPCASRFLSSNFLGPVLTAGMSADVLSTVFGPAASVFANRGEALERSWEAAWRAAYQSDLFADSFLNLWPKRPWPSLILSTTLVNTGDIAILSNIYDVSRHKLSIGFPTFRLSTAVHNSARFPIISPSGRLMLPTISVNAQTVFISPLSVEKTNATVTWKHFGTLVDGGYADNFGASALDDLITRLDDIQCEKIRASMPGNSGYTKTCNDLLATKRFVRYVVIQITSDTEAVNACDEPPSPARIAGNSTNELPDALVPLVTLINSRDVTGIEGAKALSDEVQRLYLNDTYSRYSGMFKAGDHAFDKVYFHFPLGAQLYDPDDADEDGQENALRQSGGASSRKFTATNTRTGIQLRMTLRPASTISIAGRRPPLNWVLTSQSRDVIEAQFKACGNWAVPRLQRIAEHGMFYYRSPGFVALMQCEGAEIGLDDQDRVESCTRSIKAKDISESERSMAFFYRGAFLLKRNASEKAVSDFSEALKLQPKNAYALNGRCIAEAAENRLESSLGDCNRALEIQPDNAAMRTARGQVYLKLGRFDDALSDFQAAIRLNPKSPHAIFGRGITKLKMGDHSGQSDVDAAKVIDPQIEDEFAISGLKN